VTRLQSRAWNQLPDTAANPHTPHSRVNCASSRATLFRSLLLLHGKLLPAGTHSPLGYPAVNFISLFYCFVLSHVLRLERDCLSVHLILRHPTRNKFSFDRGATKPSCTSFIHTGKDSDFWMKKRSGTIQYRVPSPSKIWRTPAIKFS
jgi:hypothetical protein